MSLRLFIGGMRGSQPALGAAFEEFGGHTTSLLVLGSHGERLVLDAGTGLQAVARQLAELGAGAVTVLFSHYHLDHVAGLTMNPLFHQADWSFRFIGPAVAGGSVRDVVTRLLAPPYWPVSWERMKAGLEFAELGEEEIQVGHLHVRGCPVPHPGGCRAYRIDDAGGGSLVFATDLEWQKRTPESETAFLTLCRAPTPADTLAIDAFFTRADQAVYAGWGHSSWEDGLDIAGATGVKRIVLGHHAPEANDQALRALEQRVQRRTPAALLARAGQWLTIAG